MMEENKRSPDFLWVLSGGFPVIGGKNSITGLGF